MIQSNSTEVHDNICEKNNHGIVLNDLLIV
ncbi:MAG: hypothetical protein ACTSQF_07125 [Candidatus Heimdallarchaeaceae archaeon]